MTKTPHDKLASAGGKKMTGELEGILQKLRPFQREAFDFATEGTISQRQFAGIDERGYSTSNKKKEAFHYDKELVGKGRILLADEMGLGKSITSLAIMTNYMNEWPLLILCPASLRHTWPAEIEKFLPSIPPQSVYIVSGFDDADFYVNESKRNRIRIVIATYSLLQDRSAAARVLEQFKFQCIIADESHNLKERNSQRCKLAMPMLQKAKRLVLLSGTPALARPVELWPQVHCIAPKLFGSYTAYTKQYCNARRGRFGWDVSGTSNQTELHQKLRQIMVRRLKSNVLSELPPKQRSIVPVNIDSERLKECRELMEQLKQTRMSVDELLGEEAREAHFEARRLLMAGYQASGVGKAQAVAEYLVDWLSGSGTQKILVFAHHKHVLDTLENAVAKKFKGAGHIRIDGSVPAKERAVRVRMFQTNSKVRVGVLSMTAAGVGLTLTAASSVMFAELHWTPGVICQCEDRCHRISQKNAVNVMFCVCKDEDLSVDKRLWAMLSRKIGTLGKVIDGCSGASMNAHDRDAFQAKRSGQYESAEDDLVRFFAETSAGENRPAKTHIPAKGSILSFFKPTGPSANGSSTKAQEQECAPKGGSPQMSASRSPQQIASPKVVPWVCGTCTFINTRTNRRNGWLSCEMCGSSFAVEVAEDVQVVSASIYSIRPTSGVTEDVIVLDSDSEEAHNFSQKTPKAPVVVDLDDPTDMLSIVNPFSRPTKKTRLEKRGNEPVQTKSEGFLRFAVSPNSGRVLLHRASTGESLHCGFEIDTVLTDDCADELLASSVKRSLVPGRSHDLFGLSFDDDKVLNVIRSVPIPEADMQLCCRDLKAFVAGYVRLRSVEKEALRQYGTPISPYRLSQVVAQIMTSNRKAMSTKRYAGGAKERARLNLQESTTTAGDRAVLAGTACAWCAKQLPSTSLAEGVKATYCSRTCAEKGRLGRGGMYASSRVRTQVFGLEGGVCQKCGIDANALFLRVSALQPSERLSVLCNASWRLPSSRTALERLLQNPKESDFWQADHIVAVSEGGGSCGLENLRTLCNPCHRTETDRLRARLRLSGGTKQHEASTGGKQMDIRSAFFSSRT